MWGSKREAYGLIPPRDERGERSGSSVLCSAQCRVWLHQQSVLSTSLLCQGIYIPQCSKYMRGIYLCALCGSLPDPIIKLRTNFSRAKLIVKRIFLTIQSHNLKSNKVFKISKIVQFA